MRKAMFAVFGGLLAAGVFMASPAHAEDCSKYVGRDAMGNDQTGLLRGCCAAAQLTGGGGGPACSQPSSAPNAHQ
jgi:hypothetical protein